MKTPCLLLQVTSGLIPVENTSELLLALTILKDSAPVAEKTKVDCTLLDF